MDQIQENEGGAQGKLGTLLLASLGGACLVFAAVALLKKPSGAKKPPKDPLAELARTMPSASAARPRGLGASDVTFPGLLSDDPRPTTALAAVRKGSRRGSENKPFRLPEGAPTTAPEAGDRLPVVPLPARGYLGATPVVTNPRDPLTSAAKVRATPESSPAVAEGRTGRFVLQVSSFRREPEAQAFSLALRRKGYHSYVRRATVPGKGQWYRVRIGPFKSGWKAKKFGKDFESREHIVPFIVETEKERKNEAAREVAFKEREAHRKRIRIRRHR